MNYVHLCQLVMRVQTTHRTLSLNKYNSSIINVSEAQVGEEGEERRKEKSGGGLFSALRRGHH